MLSRVILTVLLPAAFLLFSAGCGSQQGDHPPAASINEAGAEEISQAGTGPAASGDAASSPGTKSGPQGDPLHPIVEIATSHGPITIRLDAVNAPLTVQNFMEYVNDGFYNNTAFHYVDSASMILGGGFTADLEPKEASSPIRNEAHNGLKNAAGTIAMSRQYDAIDSATSQFFINVADNPQLDHQDDATAETYGYCVFGEVTAGMEVVESIAQAEVKEEDEFVNTPRERVVIQSVRLLR